MSQYDSFRDFMLSVVDSAERKQSELFPTESLKQEVKEALCEGWEFFVSITSVIDRTELSEKDYFMLSSNTWLTSILLGLRSDVPMGASAMLMNLHNHREIAVAIKDVGLMYKAQFEKLVGERVCIDSLVEEASDELVRMIEGI